MKEILRFWAGMAAIVGGIFALVAGSMLAMSPFMSPQAVGFVWCGAMFVGIIVVGSWAIYDDKRQEERLRILRTLWLIDHYSAHLR